MNAHPSLNFLLDQYERALAQLRAHFEGADRKVAALIVASGVLIGLSPAMSLWFLVPGLISLLIAGGLGIWAFWPRKYPIIRVGRLRSYVNHAEESTKLTMLDTYEVMIEQTEQMVRDKGRRLKGAFAAFAVAAVIFAAGIVAAAIEGAAMSQAPDRPPEDGQDETPPPRQPDLSLIGYIEEAQEPEAEARQREED